ncbi:serine/threonine-protein kinase [Corallococcus sp. CA054B]|uniref:serine/threonine-protein kinase n=1 Tax=Corallococcus sp. CA054B TaxID=2316734 RepID=UPI001F246167|nr:serine/threonine-protein kinase [Corallococcus sp. CA054B]
MSGCSWEARAVNAVRHPGIIDTFGFGTLPDERPYVTMELLQGQALSDFVRVKRTMDLESIVWVMDQVLSALGAAHRAGIVHRDLEARQRLHRRSARASVTVKLVDFGIAKLLESRDKPLTADDLVLGTPEFMAPEQIRGDTVGPATDLYAAGVMMFQLLTGMRPFQGETVQVMFAHLEQAPPLPSSRLAGLPKEVDALVLQLLAKCRPASRGAWSPYRNRRGHSCDRRGCGSPHASGEEGTLSAHPTAPEGVVPQKRGRTRSKSAEGGTANDCAVRQLRAHRRGLRGAPFRAGRLGRPPRTAAPPALTRVRRIQPSGDSKRRRARDVHRARLAVPTGAAHRPLSRMTKHRVNPSTKIPPRQHRKQLFQECYI